MNPDGSGNQPVATSLSLPIIRISDGEVSAFAGMTYYVDCAGSDNNTGLSTSSAWKTLIKANKANLQPGDRLLLKRGCVFTGTLVAKWNGTATANILIGAYGSGNMPKIQNTAADVADQYYNGVEITGSYQVIEYIETTAVNLPVDPGCRNNPIGFYIGFNFRNPNNVANGASYNVLRNSKASKFTAGVHLNTNTHHNRITKNTIVENGAMQVLTPISVGRYDDIGAWGLVLRGNYQEVSYNYFSNNNAVCTYDTPPQGNSIELYEAKYANIHHNTSINDRDFSEMGGSAAVRADSNTYAYNLVISNIRDSHFIITRGSGNQYGPVYRTQVLNNTVYYTGVESEGIVCGAGCSPTILTARNNILWAEKKAIFGDNRFNESNNVYWNSAGAPFVQLLNASMSSTSRIANPQFVDPATHNLRLRSTSPAINRGVSIPYQRDLDGLLVPIAGLYDVGAYEFNTSSPTGSPLEGVGGDSLLYAEDGIMAPMTDTLELNAWDPTMTDWLCMLPNGALTDTATLEGQPACPTYDSQPAEQDPATTESYELPLTESYEVSPTGE